MAGTPIPRGQMVPSPPSTGGTGSGIPIEEKGAPQGVATLDSSAKISLDQLQLSTEAATRFDDVEDALASLAIRVPGTASGNNTGDQFTAMTAARVLGRVTAGFGPAEQLTGAQVQAMLDLSTYATNAALTAGLATKQAAGSYLTGITSGMVTTALGFTPQPAGSYLTSITSGNVTTALGYTPTSVAGLTGSQTLAAFKAGLGLTGTNSGDQDLSSYATIAALTSGLATKQAAGTYASGTGSASGTNTGDETKATIDAKLGATGGADFYRKDGTWATPAGGSGGSDPWTWTKLSADSAANSTVTLTTAGLSFAAEANTTYIVRIVGGFIAAATTTGIALALDVPTGCIVAGTGYHMTTAAGASAGFEQIADNATIGATTGVRAANTLTPIEASWIIETGATAGTVTLMFRSEIAGSAVTLKKPFGFGVRLI